MGRPLTVCTIVGLLVLLGAVSHAAIVKYEFGGTVTSMEPLDLHEPWNQVQIGDPWSISYQFDPKTADSAPDDPTWGEYDGAITSFSVQIGDAKATYGGGNIDGSSITVYHYQESGYSLRIDMADGSSWYLTLRGPYTIWDGDALPTGDLNVNAFTQQRAFEADLEDYWGPAAEVEPTNVPYARIRGSVDYQRCQASGGAHALPPKSNAQRKVEFLREDADKKYPNRPWGEMVYNVQGKTFDFRFFGRDLDMAQSYTLIYYPEPFPGKGLICLGSGTTDTLMPHYLWISGSMDTGDLPAPYDLNPGARIALVPSEIVDFENSQLKYWSPFDNLVARELITFDDLDDN